VTVLKSKEAKMLIAHIPVKEATVTMLLEKREIAIKH
jgi:hypothetical protein